MEDVILLAQQMQIVIVSEIYSISLYFIAFLENARSAEQEIMQIAMADGMNFIIWIFQYVGRIISATLKSAIHQWTVIFLFQKEQTGSVPWMINHALDLTALRIQTAQARELD